MKLREQISLSPINVQHSVRAEEIRCLTSCRAGEIIPVAYVPLLREDRVSSGNLRLRFSMDETVEPLINSIAVTAYVHFIPFTAFPRFDGLDSFNRSYMGEPEPATGQPIPFFTQVQYQKAHEFWNKLGVQWAEGTPINAAPLEAFNVLVNYRRNARTEKLPQRGLYDTGLPRGFWKNTNLSYVVPDYDASLIDGEVPITFGNVRMNIRSSAYSDVGADNPKKNTPSGEPGWVPPVNSEGQYYWENKIFVQLRDAIATMSLANVEAAKQTAAFARLREQFSGIEDDHIIDLLMTGIRVPDEMLKHPILLDRQSTIYGYSTRHAMDGASMEQSVTTGVTELTMRFRLPPVNTGGIIFVTAEIVPEQLYERQMDSFLYTTEPRQLPDFLRDYLDPEKIDVVYNRFVDVYHSDPNGIFGYAPLNHGWKRSITRVGGRYFRPNPDVFVEDRQRIWAVETEDPTLTDDFYLVPADLPHTPFLDMEADPFEILTLGRVEIVGRTVFGPSLEEDQGNYDAVAEWIDWSRLPDPSPDVVADPPASTKPAEGGAE